MLHLNWHKVLPLFLLISPHVLLGVLAAVLYKRRLYREFRCFFVYVVYEIAKFIPLFTLYFVLGVASKVYAYAYCATLMVSIALRFGVVDDVSRDLFRESSFLKGRALRSLRWVTGVLLVISILLAVYAPGDRKSGFVTGIFVINRGAAMVQCGLLLSLLLFSRFFGLSWRRPAFGIALGLAVLTSLDLAMFALRAELSNEAGKEILNLLITGTYLVCVLIWIGYLLAPEVEPVTSPAVLPQDEVESWNTELQHLLKD
jgi:hypothetical protein